MRKSLLSLLSVVLIALSAGCNVEENSAKTQDGSIKMSPGNATQAAEPTEQPPSSQGEPPNILSVDDYNEFAEIFRLAKNDEINYAENDFVQDKSRSWYALGDRFFVLEEYEKIKDTVVLAASGGSGMELINVSYYPDKGNYQYITARYRKGKLCYTITSPIPEIAEAGRQEILEYVSEKEPVYEKTLRDGVLKMYHGFDEYGINAFYYGYYFTDTGVVGITVGAGRDEEHDSRFEVSMDEIDLSELEAFDFVPLEAILNLDTVQN